MDSTGGESSLFKEAEDDALLAGMHSTGEESSMGKGVCTDSTRRVPRKEAGEFSMQSVRADSTDPESSIWILTRWCESNKSAKRMKYKMDEEAVADMDSAGVDFLVHEEAESELRRRLEVMGIRPEMRLYAEIQRAVLHIQDKLAKEMKMDKKTLRQLIILMSNEFDTSTVESDTLLIKPAGPSATDSVTRLGHYYAQDDIRYDDMPKTTDEVMAIEAKNFALWRTYYESAWSKTCGPFEHTTALCSMQFTHYTPGRSPHNGAASNPATLQIFSINIAKIAGGLEWPLSVYGVVAIRDVVDHNRNLLFSCDRDDSQQLTQNDPFLRLIGPSRAVVYTDMVNFEIQLKVKGTTESQDKALITEARDYHEVFDHGVTAVFFKNCFCTIELRVQIVRVTTQATILGVQVVKGDRWPFEYGARVACSSLPGKIGVTEDKQATFLTCPPTGEVVMVDSKDGAMLKGFDGYLHLPRNVISVESRGRLDVVIQAYSKSGDIAAQDHVSFAPKYSKITRKKCFLDDVMVVITVAWSQVATDKRNVMALGCLV